ncbi:MAG TPA: lysylphosphatidylglycerol synthase transmembrane domain-containing protein [Gammaproteobacteria bacterium]
MTVSVALAAVIVYNVDGLEEVWGSIVRADPVYLLLAFLVLTLDRFLMSYKWLVLLRSRGLGLPLVQTVKIYCTAMVWGMFLPATVGADAIRGYMASREGLDGYEVFASIVVERLVGFVASLFFGLIGIMILSAIGLADERFDALWVASAGVLLGGAVSVSLSFNDRLFDRVVRMLPPRVRESRIVRRLRHFHGIYAGYGANGDVISGFFVLTLVEQYFVVLGMWLTAQALGIDVGLLFLTGVVPLSMIITRLPVTIDGIGVFEGIMILLLGMTGVPAAEALALSLVGRVLQILLWMPWWFVYTAQARSIRPPKGVTPS